MGQVETHFLFILSTNKPPPQTVTQDLVVASWREFSSHVSTHFPFSAHREGVEGQGPTIHDIVVGSASNGAVQDYTQVGDGVSW